MIPSTPALPTLKDALARYFEENHFGADGGYAAAWVDFKLGPIPFPFPNTEPRRRAVRFHDLHHIVTGYRTDVAGEFEISAWEIGSGCRGFVAAWQLNLGGMGGGALYVPRRLFTAFVRGRSSDNFYGREYDAALLALSVEDARAALRLDRTPLRATVTDRFLFALAVAGGLLVASTLFVLFLPIAVLSWPALFLAARRARRKTAAS